MTCGGFGSVPEGTAAFDFGALASAVVPATALYSGLIRVELGAVPGSLEPSAWHVEPVGGGAPVTVVLVVQVGTAWDVYLAIAMEPGRLYSIDLECEAIGFATWEEAPERKLPQAWDIANPHLIRDAGVVDPPPVGQFQINDRGDIAVETRLQGVRKRILRRITTARGGFFHLPAYGTAQPVKTIKRPAELIALAAELQRQIEREPEVVRAQVHVATDPVDTTLVMISVRAQTTLGLDVEASTTGALPPVGQPLGVARGYRRTVGQPLLIDGEPVLIDGMQIYV